MTDLERLTDFLTQAGYTLTAPCQTNDEAIPDKQYALWKHTSESARSRITSLILGNGVGYSSFYCQFDFDETGQLINHGVWE